MQKNTNRSIYDEYFDKRETSSFQTFLSGMASVFDMGGTRSSAKEYLEMIRNRPSDISRYFPDADKYWQPESPEMEKDKKS